MMDSFAINVVKHFFIHDHLKKKCISHDYQRFFVGSDRGYPLRDLPVSDIKPLH